MIVPFKKWEKKVSCHILLFLNYICFSGYEMLKFNLYNAVWKRMKYIISASASAYLYKYNTYYFFARIL